MTESDFSKIEEFNELPVYDENGSDCKKIEKPYDTKYTGEIKEARTLEEAYELIANKEYSAKGALKCHDDNPPTMSVIFWRKR